MSRWTSALRRRGHERHTAFLKSLHECVGRIRPKTSATLAVVLRGSSGSYRDVAILFGAAIAWLGLIVILLVPEDIHPWLVPFDVLGLFLLAAWPCSRSRLRRWLTSRKRRRRQARTAAQAAFVDEGILHAKYDQGVLIYWSQLERHIEVIADTGVLTVIPPHEWNQEVFALRRMAHHSHGGTAFLEQLTELGHLLAKHLPPIHADEHSALHVGGGQ